MSQPSLGQLHLIFFEEIFPLLLILHHNQKEELANLIRYLQVVYI